MKHRYICPFIYKYISTFVMEGKCSDIQALFSEVTGMATAVNVTFDDLSCTMYSALEMANAISWNYG